MFMFSVFIVFQKDTHQIFKKTDLDAQVVSLTHFSQVQWTKGLPGHAFLRGLVFVLIHASVGTQKVNTFFFHGHLGEIWISTPLRSQKVILAPVKPGVALLCRCLLDRIRYLGHTGVVRTAAESKASSKMTTNPFLCETFSHRVGTFFWVLSCT